MSSFTSHVSTEARLPGVSDGSIAAKILAGLSHVFGSLEVLHNHGGLLVRVVEHLEPGDRDAGRWAVDFRLICASVLSTRSRGYVGESDDSARTRRSLLTQLGKERIRQPPAGLVSLAPMGHSSAPTMAMASKMQHQRQVPNRELPVGVMPRKALVSEGSGGSVVRPV